MALEIAYWVEQVGIQAGWEGLLVTVCHMSNYTVHRPLPLLSLLLSPLGKGQVLSAWTLLHLNKCVLRTGPGMLPRAHTGQGVVGSHLAKYLSVPWEGEARPT